MQNGNNASRVYRISRYAKLIDDGEANVNYSKMGCYGNHGPNVKDKRRK